MNYLIIYVLKYRGTDISFDLYMNFVTLLFEVHVCVTFFYALFLIFSIYIGLM